MYLIMSCEKSPACKDGNAYEFDPYETLKLILMLIFLVCYACMISIGAEHSLKHGCIENNVIG